jgi:hypothetical protein
MGDSLPGTAQLERRAKRPSVLDRRFRGDPCVEERRDGTLVLLLGNFNLAVLRGLALDLPHLNGLLNRLRERLR